MLTESKIRLLFKYNWDVDMFLRAGSTSEKTLMKDIDWGKYEQLLQDLFLVTKKLVSKEYAQVVHRRLVSSCDSEATAQTLLGYASTL